MLVEGQLLPLPPELLQVWRKPIRILFLHNLGNGPSSAGVFTPFSPLLPRRDLGPVVHHRHVGHFLADRQLGYAWHFSEGCLDSWNGDLFGIGTRYSGMSWAKPATVDRRSAREGAVRSSPSHSINNGRLSRVLLVHPGTTETEEL